MSKNTLIFWNHPQDKHLAHMAKISFRQQSVDLQQIESVELDIQISDQSGVVVLLSPHLLSLIPVDEESRQRVLDEWQNALTDGGKLPPPALIFVSSAVDSLELLDGFERSVSIDMDQAALGDFNRFVDRSIDAFKISDATKSIE